MLGLGQWPGTSLIAARKLCWRKVIDPSEARKAEKEQRDNTFDRLTEE